MPHVFFFFLRFWGFVSQCTIMSLVVDFLEDLCFATFFFEDGVFLKCFYFNANLKAGLLFAHQSSCGFPH